MASRIAIVVRKKKRKRPDGGSSASSSSDGLLSEACGKPEVLVGCICEWSGGRGEVLGIKSTDPLKFRVLSGGSVKLFDVRKKKKLRVISKRPPKGEDPRREKTSAPAQPEDMAQARRLAKERAVTNRQDAEKGPGPGSIDAIFGTIPGKLREKKEREKEHEKQMREDEEEEQRIAQEEARWLGRDTSAEGGSTSTDGMGGWKWDGSEGLDAAKKDLAPSRYTDTGMPVYKLHAINFLNRKGGRTPQCPFDCSCCF